MSWWWPYKLQFKESWNAMSLANHEEDGVKPTCILCSLKIKERPDPVLHCIVVPGASCDIFYSLWLWVSRRQNKTIKTFSCPWSKRLICLVFSCASVWLLLQSMALVSRRSVSLAYREEDAVPSGNATTQSYLRCLEAALDHADPGFWAPPFWDCYLSKWVFGFTVALPGQRSVQYSLSFNSTEQQWRNYRIRFLDTFACQPQPAPVRPPPVTTTSQPR